MKEAPATDVDRAALESGQRSWEWSRSKCRLPDWPYDSLSMILFAEAAASFEELTLNATAWTS